jgi:hypothetical protein
MSPSGTSILKILRALSLFDPPLRRELFTVLARGWPIAGIGRSTPRREMRPGPRRD